MIRAYGRYVPEFGGTRPDVSGAITRKVGHLARKPYSAQADAAAARSMVVMPCDGPASALEA